MTLRRTQLLVSSALVFGFLGLWLGRRKTGSKRLLGDPSMLKTIAAESRSPKEFARRAEAWASTEARPPSITTMAKAYRRAKPWTLAKLIREARAARESGSRERFESLISSHEGDDLDGLGAPAVGGKDLWLSRLKKKHDTVADLKKEIAESKAAIAKRSKKKRKVTDSGYGDECRLIEHQWNQIRDREQAIAAFTKTPDANTPRPTACPPPMVLQYQDEPLESEADREYGWAFMDPPDKRPAKPAGYDERVRARAEHKRLADEEWKTYKARGLWGADDDDDFFERSMRESAERKANMLAALKQHDAVIVTGPQGRRSLLIKTPEMSNTDEGSIRVTTFLPDGPEGHITRKSIERLAEDLARDLYPKNIEPATEADVMAWTGTPEFEEGSARVAEMQRRNAGLKGGRRKGLGEPVMLVGPRGEDLGLIVELETPGKHVGITTEDGRTFLYDKLTSEWKGLPVYREYREHTVLNDAKLDRKMARASLREEREAIDVYGKRLPKAKSKALKKALRHARKEEREHAAMFKQLLSP